MSDANKIDIPERHQAFCKAVARLAREHNMTNFSGSYRPSYQDNWRAAISFSWEAGRHGEDSDQIKISSQLFVDTKIG